MIRTWLLSASLVFLAFCQGAAQAQTANSDGLAAHKAVYDIGLTETHSGSQVLNISGQMNFQTSRSCGAWVTDHHFKLFYEYADGPGMRIASDFSTYESSDGKDMSFSSRRTRAGEMYQEIRGNAVRSDKGTGKATYTMPENTHYVLGKGTFFPAGHTAELVRRAKAGDKFFSAIVFDGSDEEGPLEINAFIGKEIKTDPVKGDKIDASLLKDRAWSVRMAVFPEKDKEEESDYEMSLVLHENGIISDMTIEYDEFTVKQKLVSLEKLPADDCVADDTAPKGKV